jgi:hypothetical protein
MEMKELRGALKVKEFNQLHIHTVAWRHGHRGYEKRASYIVVQCDQTDSHKKSKQQSKTTNAAKAIYQMKPYLNSEDIF